MSDFMNDLFADTSKETGINIVDDENNFVINESIVLDMLNNDTKAFKTVLDSVGKYAARDGILSESIDVDCTVASFNDIPCPNTAAILAIAKESGSKDYELYTKSIMLMQACMEHMKEKFGEAAEKRIEAQKNEISNNSRLMDAISEAKCSRE